MVDLLDKQSHMCQLAKLTCQHGHFFQDVCTKNSSLSLWRNSTKKRQKCLRKKSGLKVDGYGWISGIFYLFLTFLCTIFWNISDKIRSPSKYYYHFCKIIKKLILYPLWILSHFSHIYHLFNPLNLVKISIISQFFLSFWKIVCMFSLNFCHKERCSIQNILTPDLFFLKRKILSCKWLPRTWLFWRDFFADWDSFLGASRSRWMA